MEQRLFPTCRRHIVTHVERTLALAANQQACSCRARGAPEYYRRGTCSDSATRINRGQALVPRLSGGLPEISVFLRLKKSLIARGVTLSARCPPSSTLATTLSWPRHSCRNIIISRSSANARAWREHEQDRAHSWRNVNRYLLIFFFRSSSPTFLGERCHHQASETHRT